MARNSRSTRKSGGGFGTALLSFILGGAIVGGAGYAYLHYRPQHSRLAEVPDAEQPAVVERHHESAGVPAPAPAPVERAKRVAPFGISEDVFESGARVYAKDCASCHGKPGHEAAATHPPARQLWAKSANGAIGLSGGDPGDLYGTIANGTTATGRRLAGMPAYAHSLTPTQIWQVSLLLTGADKELPEPVARLLATH